MVLEEIFDQTRLRHRPYLALFFGFAFTFVAFIFTYLLFRSMMSVAMVFLIALFLVPTFLLLVKKEEQVERKFGLRHFFRNHKDIFEVYLFSFIGVFLAFVVLGLAAYGNASAYENIFSFQTRFLEFQQGVDSGVVQSFVQVDAEPKAGHVLGLFTHDLVVLMICFVLSFFYGASAMFLIILNGSVFASFIVLVIRTISRNAVQGVQAFFFFLIHLLPEISGFLMAAIAGGVVSKALLHEKKGSLASRNVFKDATMLMLIAIGLILLGALLEVFVTARLFQVFF
jgi:uncharacterized membrane protein SpoIIM required for sporulation